MAAAQKRRLGSGETWLALLHDQTLGTAQATILVSIDAALTQQHFLQTLQQLMQHYQILRTRLELEESGYCLVEGVSFNEIPILVASYDHADDWQRHMQAQANEMLPRQRYLWRAKLLKPAAASSKLHHVLLTFHHSIFDGFSALAIVDSFLEVLNDPSSNRPRISIPEPIEKLAKLPTSGDPQGQQIINQLDQIVKYQWPHQTPSPLDKRVTRFLFRDMTVDSLQKLRQACKQHKVSINSALNAAMLLSAQRFLAEPANIGLSTPINLRPLTANAIGKYDLGFFCTVINTIHQHISQESSFWSLAAEYQRQLLLRYEHMQLTVDFDFKEYKTGMDVVWDKSRENFCYNFMVTNLGLLTFEHESPDFPLKALRFGTCRQAGDNNMMLLVNSTREGLFCTFGYTYPLISHQWADDFVKHFFKLLAEIV